MSLRALLNRSRGNFPIDSCTATQVERALSKNHPGEEDFAALLSDAALHYLEPMAQKASELTRRHFGNAVILFTPLYVSNFCENACAYCSFARQHAIERKHSTFEEIRREAEAIARTGMRHVLLLTGESARLVNGEYLATTVRILREFFSSISIEIYPLDEEGYGALIREGVDGLTIYQEVYDETIYARLHKGGPKQDYGFRLEAPDRAAGQGIHAVTIGPLLGLGDFRREAVAAARHLRYLQETYPAAEVSVALPRLRPLVSDFAVEHPVSDRRFVQVLTAFRIMFPSVGITISTRESREFRDAVLPLGITKMSAGVSTAVGGHTGKPSTAQFEIADTRGVEEVKTDLLARGFQPVMHDWSSRLLLA